jgi:BMFP domain-containing protein YqiC
VGQRDELSAQNQLLLADQGWTQAEAQALRARVEALEADCEAFKVRARA